MSTSEQPTRRTVLQTAGVIGTVAVFTAACGSSASSTATAATTTPAGTTPTTPAGASAGAATSGQTLGPTSGVPVGGGTIYAAQEVVVTQPTAGSYKAFSAVCPHQGCLVNDISNGAINCPCHGSQFSLKDGSVIQGPAASGLAVVTVTEAGGTITLTG
jgi:Rieske Fe-S protein